MSGAEKDDVPMLSYTRPQLYHEDMEVGLRRPVSTSRSASMSTAMYSVDSFENENRFLSFTGPLQRERKIQMSQMSGPLYSTRKSDYPIWSKKAQKGRPSATVQTLDNSSSIRTNKVWPHDNHADKNENLLRSGKLGVCNDPYCTTCPTYYSNKASQQKKYSSPFESKVILVTLIACM